MKRKLLLLALLTALYSCGTSSRIEVIKDITFSECKDCNGDDVKLKLDVYRPDSKCLPVILWVHGGGMCVGSKDVYWDPVSFLAEAMIARGYIFVSMDYRLNSEWEKQDAFKETIKNAAEDVSTAVEWIRSNARKYGMDSEKIILAGYSSGAEIVANYYYSNSLLDDDESDKSGIVAVISVSGNRLFYDGERNTSTGKAPCMIIHGDSDDINPISDAELLCSQLGSKARMVIMPGNGHTWTETDASKSFLIDNMSGFIADNASR